MKFRTVAIAIAAVATIAGVALVWCGRQLPERLAPTAAAATRAADRLPSSPTGSPTPPTTRDDSREVAEFDAIRELDRAARALEARRLEKKDSFPQRDGLRKLSLVLRRPDPRERAELDNLFRHAKRRISDAGWPAETEAALLRAADERRSIFTDYPKEYRIVNIVPFWSGKQNAWSFFYGVFDCDEVVMSGSNGVDTGFAPADDGGRRSESDDREFAGWRYSWLAEPAELDALVPEDDSSA